MECVERLDRGEGRASGASHKLLPSRIFNFNFARHHRIEFQYGICMQCGGEHSRTLRSGREIEVPVVERSDVTSVSELSVDEQEKRHCLPSPSSGDSCIVIFVLIPIP